MQAFLIDVLRLCAWLAVLAALLVPLERRWGRRPQKFLRKAFGTDLGYYFLSGLAPKVLMILPLTVLAMLVHQLEPAPFYHWASGAPFWLRLLAATLVSEVGGYWGHRWSHEIPFLWRFHAVHHSSEELDWLVSSRAHPVDKVFMRLCGLVPLYVLGLAQPSADDLDLAPVLVAIFGNAWGFFIHSNVNWRLGWLEWVISTPAYHHWHHTNDGPEVLNKNYAAMLPFVDRLFGTHYLPREEWPVKYGIDAIGEGAAMPR
jgi:sterol desaturase/sphingolipid hydroxylase (fatty acid hydroxylase superfamily)